MLRFDKLFNIFKLILYDICVLYYRKKVEVTGYLMLYVNELAAWKKKIILV